MFARSAAAQGLVGVCIFMSTWKWLYRITPPDEAPFGYAFAPNDISKLRNFHSPGGLVPFHPRLLPKYRTSSIVVPNCKDLQTTVKLLASGGSIVCVHYH
jgi:hypothetical protein